MDVVLNSGARHMRMLTGHVGDAAIRHPLTIPPTIVGAKGRAWQCDIEAGRRKLNLHVDDDATLAIWVMEVPWAHPLFHSFSITLVHLRPMKDGRKTIFYRPNATHEFWLYVLNPDVPLDEVVKTGVDQPWLSPVNFSAQITEITDKLAKERIERTVREVIDGKLSPDSDNMNDWSARFGNAMVKKQYR